MTSTTRSRFGEFGSTSMMANGEQSRTLPGATFGSPFAAGMSTWNGGIWAKTAIGSGIKGGSNDTAHSRDTGTDLADPSEVITGSGSLLPSSELDNWGRSQNTPWTLMNGTTMDKTSPGLSGGHVSQSSNSPTRHRNSNQHGPSQSSYFSVTQPLAIGQGTATKASQQTFLDPTSVSFKAANSFEALSQNHSARHNSDDTNRRPINSINFGSDEMSLSAQTGRYSSNTTAGYSGYTSSAASRSGSLPPSRNGTDKQTQFGDDFHANAQTKSMSHRPNLSTNTSTYAVQVGNQRYGDQMYPTQLSDLSHNLGKVNLSKESEDYHSHAPHDSYYDYPSPATITNVNTTWSPDDNGYRNGQRSYVPDIRQHDSLAPSLNQHRGIQFEDRASHSPSSSEARRNHDSPMYSSGGTPPLLEHHRMPSNRTIGRPVPNGPAALLDRKLRGLQQEQQGYMSPQLNPLQFRTSYGSPYEYNHHAMLRMNSLAPYYPMPGVGGYPTNRVVPRGPMLDTNSGETLRSILLEEFRSNSKGNKRYELKDIYSHVVEFSGDQHGSRFIQQKLETANSDEKDQIFREILPNSLQLMTDVFGNYVIQKFFEHGNQSQKKVLASQMKGHILDLSLQMYGCRVVQKTFEHILTDQQASLVKELEQQVLKCVKDQNGNHVVQKAIERIPAEHIQFIINAFTGQVHGLATHPYGCRVIQRMLEHCQEPSRTMLLQELHACASTLIVDQYGNYVTQHVIEHGRGEDRARIISLVTVQLVLFSKHKFASNVVEKSIEFGTDEQRRDIVKQLIVLDNKGESPIQSLIKDQYGNYVIQKLLANLKTPEVDEFVEHIKPQLQQVKRFSFGKQIAAIEKHIYSSPPSHPQLHGNANRPSQLDTSAAPTPPLLTEDTQSPQSSSLPSTNNSTVDGPIGDGKSTAASPVEITTLTST